MRPARRAATWKDSACRMPTAKNVTPKTSGDASKRRAKTYATNACTTNPPPKESRAKSADSLCTLARDAPSGARGTDGSGAGASTASDSVLESTRPPAAATVYTKKSRCDDGGSGRSDTRATTSAPTDPAMVAIALYAANVRAVPSGPGTPASMGCSSVVNGPDSTTSAEIVPVSAARTRAGSQSVSAKVEPAAAMRANKTAYARLRPTRSPRRPRTTEAAALPISTAPRTTPSSAESRPAAASPTPRAMLPTPYANARSA